MTIYNEIEAKVTNKNTLETKLVTVIEHAYGVHDAAMQLCYSLMRDGPNVDISIQRIGPPLADIQEQDARMREEIRQRTDVLKAPTFKTALDAVGVLLSGGHGKATTQGPPRQIPQRGKA